MIVSSFFDDYSVAILNVMGLLHTLALLQCLCPLFLVFMVAMNTADAWQLLHFFDAQPCAWNRCILCTTIIQWLKKVQVKIFEARLLLWCVLHKIFLTCKFPNLQ